MSLETACPDCGKRYRAASHMAGRQVRCRGCGAVFPLSGDAGAVPPEPEILTEADDFDPFRIGPPKSSNNPDVVFEQAFAGYRPGKRLNGVHPFPYAYLIDQWLPRILPATAIVWLILQILTSNDTGASWVVALRLGLAAAAYLLVVYPLGWQGMSLGCRIAKYERPPNPGKRVLTATLFPYVLLLAIWLMVGSLGGAIPGVVVAFLVSVGLAWLLFRPAPEESAIALGIAGAAFLITVAILVLAAVGANEGAQAIVRASKTTNSFAVSPVGPGLAWDVPVAAVVKKSEVSPVIVAEADESARLGPLSNIPDLRIATTTQPAPTSSVTQPATPPAVPPRPDFDPFDSSPLFRHPTTRLATEPAQPTDPPVVPGDPVRPEPVRLPDTQPDTAPAAVAPTPLETKPIANDSIAERLIAMKSKFVGQAKRVRGLGTYDHLIFPTTPGSAMLLVRKSAANGPDTLEVWDPALLSRLGSIQVAPEAAAEDGGYALSPDGKTVARITAFPSSSLELIPTAGGATTIYRLPQHGGPAAVVGFAGADRVVVRWEDTDRVWIACCEIKAKTLKPGTLVIGTLVPAANAISPSGRWFAGIGDIPDKSGVRLPQLALIDLTRGQSRVMPIIGVDPQAAGPPTALTFSGDDKRLAALYERNGALVLIGWRLPEARQLPTLAVPMGKVPPPAPGGVGRLTSVMEGRAWLVGGNALLDPENGRLLGELGVAESVSVSAYLDTVRLMYLEAGERQMLLVRLVPTAFASTTRPATKPAP